VEPLSRYKPSTSADRNYREEQEQEKDEEQKEQCREVSNEPLTLHDEVKMSSFTAILTGRYRSTRDMRSKEK